MARKIIGRGSRQRQITLGLHLSQEDLDPDPPEPEDHDDSFSRISPRGHQLVLLDQSDGGPEGTLGCLFPLKKPNPEK